MHKFLTRVLSTAVLVCATAGLASAAQWPNATYPDTLNLYQVQFGMANPGAGAPALLDTVMGVGGIITGFDAKATGYGFYIQTSDGTVPWTGVDVFTGSFNYNAAPFSLALGDSVIVYGRIQEFGGGTEIEGFDGVQGTNDIIVRKLSSGNPLPAIHGGTTTQLRETPKGNVLQEQYEGMLVQINGPLVVARNSGVGTRSFLLVDPSAPSDSVNIDGNTLTTYEAPAVGTTVTLVRGIYEERTRGYRIQIRDGNDIDLATPPNVTDGYPVADTQVRLTFDRAVTSATATDINNYSLASFGSVDAATMDGSSAVLLDITNGLPHGASETVTVSGIVSVSSGLAMTAPQSRTFINGVLSCAEVQAPNPDSLAGIPCLDRSRFAGGGGQTSQGNIGPRMSMTGVVQGIYTPLHYLADEGGGLRSGVSIFAPPTLPVLGHKMFVTGQVQEFFGETEVGAIVSSTDLGVATAPAAATPDLSIIDHDGCDPNESVEDAEDYEGMLVKVAYGKVILAEGLVTPPTNGFHIMNQAGTDTIFVSNLNGVLSPFSVKPLGMTCTVTGVLHYSNNSFRICPRDYGDIVDHGMNVSVPPASGKVRFAAYPNPGVTSRLSFSLPTEANVELGVFDVAGRQVAQLARGRMPAGEYSREWDGRTSAGKVGAGVYFYRLTVDGKTYSVRNVRLGQ
ncbi:MAG: T9SS type A sorting domain-containing protein [Candidatus Eisenbacteria bacterium]|nr:T9SS type A sorting domain-containing protein [Candidatus Eisenbacteria bacterium]